MKQLYFAPVIAVVLLAAAPAHAQDASSAAKKSTAKNWTPPRVAGGQPDLQGLWNNGTITPFERPREFAEKPFLTEADVATLEKRAAAGKVDRAPEEGDVGSYNQSWFDGGDRVVPSRRSSLIIDPPDGRMPAYTPEAQKRLADARTFARLHPSDGPEFRSTTERCLTRGLPMLPGPYNNNFQIVQSPGFVQILVEAEHDVRNIPLDGRPHFGPEVRMWLGDSVGHWEGNTLVVDTTNFNDQTNFRGSGRNLHLIERFARTGPDTLVYTVTVDDPTTFVKPFTAEVPMHITKGPLFEMACHEGNYAMTGILAGARADEKAAAKK